MKKPWRKLLYETQEYPDNHTDKNTFLVDLRKNVAFREVHIKDAIIGTTLLTEELCTVVGFILIYVYLYNEWVEPELVLSLSSTLTFFGFIIYRLIYSEKIKEKLGHDLRTVLIFIVFGQLFSPVLHTLTLTISTDSIYTMTFLMMLVHFIFFDYGVDSAVVSYNLSLNASVFVAVCLASRLSSSYHAFILITVAVECFVLFPFLRRELNSLILRFMLILINIYFLMLISNMFTVLFAVTLLFVNIIFPILFVKHQKHKENIYGPWDEAIITENASL